MLLFHQANTRVRERRVLKSSNWHRNSIDNVDIDDTSMLRLGKQVIFG